MWQYSLSSWESIAWLEGPPALPASPDSSVKVKMNVDHWWDFTDRWKLKYSEKTCTSATFSTTNLKMAKCWAF